MHRLLALALVLGGSLSAAAETRVIVSVRMATDSEDEPVAGAVVSFVPDTLGASPKPVASASTDLNGLAALTIPPGQYVVTASAPGFETLSTQAKFVGIDSALNFVLTPADPDAVIPDVRTRILSSGTATVIGRLLTIDGAPLRGATVGLSETSLSAHGLYGSTTHAEDGTFRAVAPFVPSGTYTLTVTASGLPVQRMPPIIFVPDVDKVSIRVPVAPDQDMPVGDIRLPAHAMYRLRVTVADGSGRTPDEAKVEVYLPPTRTTYTNREGRFGVKFGPRESVPWREPDGSYNFGPLPPGPVTVYAVNNRLNPQLTAMATVDVQPGALNEIHLELLPGARISGRVEFDGGTRPLWGAEPLRVRAVAAGQLRNNSRDPGLVAEDGTFQINGIVGRRCLRVDNIPGGWRLASIEHAGRDITYVPVDLELGQEVRVNVLLVPGEKLRSDLEPKCDPE